MNSRAPIQELVYGEDDPRRQVIHVLAPARRSAPRPAVMLFHGGGLVAGTPLQDLDWAEPLAARGFVACMAGYRLFDAQTGKDGWPAQLADARRALRTIRAHATDLNVDPGRVCAMGHSSGGHLAGLLGTTDAPDGTDADVGGFSSRADCVVTISGDADLLVPYEDPATTNVLNTLLGGTRDEIPDVWRDASPAHHVDQLTVPFLVLHGNRDEGVPVQMARNLAAALAEAGIEHVYAELSAGHMDIHTRPVASALWDVFLADQMHPER